MVDLAVDISFTLLIEAQSWVCGEMACAETKVSLLSVCLFLYFARLLELISDGKVQSL
jgi:hypothetical protein